jgi:prepilin-type N-terminal cleavage/methylation domain-containing protein
MLERMRSSKGGFTLIELMIVVAIVGVLAAIAIPAYRDYVKRARMSEVLAAFDAIATGAGEYHSVLGFYPEASYGSNNLAYYSEDYAVIFINDCSDRNYYVNIKANFTSDLNLETVSAPGNFGRLVMKLTYSYEQGYTKNWSISASEIDAMFMPKH